MWTAGHGVWRSLVARFVRDEEAAGSNPVTPTSVSAGQGPAPSGAGVFILIRAATKYRNGAHRRCAVRYVTDHRVPVGAARFRKAKHRRRSRWRQRLQPLVTDGRREPPARFLRSEGEPSLRCGRDRGRRWFQSCEAGRLRACSRRSLRFPCYSARRSVQFRGPEVVRGRGTSWTPHPPDRGTRSPGEIVQASRLLRRRFHYHKAWPPRWRWSRDTTSTSP